MFQTMEGKKKKNTGLGEVSFSSYISSAEEILVHKIVEPAIQNPHPAIAPSSGIHAPAHLERNKIEEKGEISVFGAEKYFNLKLDDDCTGLYDKYLKNSLKIDNQIDLHQISPRRWPGTPSASSESSWNSQTVLLRSFVRNQSENMQTKVDGREFFSNSTASRSCLDGKSAYVNQNAGHGRVHGKDFRKEHIQIDQRPININRRKLPQAKFQVKDEFDNQSFDQMSVGSSSQELYFGPTMETQLDDPRKSLEVFDSTAMKKGDIAKNLERKLSMLTWDAIPNGPTISSIYRSSQLGDDTETDASSDLFEIENIVGKGQALFTRQASDDGTSSCLTPYAPSETSIEWSVVTASAADGSFVSDCDEKKSVENMLGSAKVLAGNKEAQRRRSGGILGCMSQKAVMVAETAYRKDEKSKPSNLHHQLPKSAAPVPSRLLQADVKMKDLDFP